MACISTASRAVGPDRALPLRYIGASCATNGSGTNSVSPPVRACKARISRRWIAQRRSACTWHATKSSLLEAAAALRLPRIGRQRDELALDAELGADRVLGQHALLAETDGRAEVALRVAGYGYTTTFFRPLRIGGEEYLVENDKFGWRFFPPEISRSLKGKNLKVEEDMVKLEGVIKECALYEVNLNLGFDIEAKVKVMIVPQKQTEKK